MVIHTPDNHLRVFVSSTLKELAEERKAVHQAIRKIRLSPVMFESGARPHPAKELYQSYLSQSQIFIGIYWQSYGWIAPGMKISGLEDEYIQSARMPKLIYIKNPAPDREPSLNSLLDRIRNEDNCSYTYFSTPAQLKILVQDDLALLLTEKFESVARGEGSEQKSKSIPVTNLPIPRNLLVGRENELSALCALLHRDDIALVTLTGTGGTGKSRLAIQVGLEMLPEFKDGVFLVRLESLTECQQVIPTIAEIFNLRESLGSRPVSEILREYLRDKHMLLILDNFEQVVESAPFIAELLEACPRLKCIVTSRVPLRLRAEREVLIPPLDVSSVQSFGSLQALSQNAAVTLFIQRAQALKPNFTITDSNAAAVAEICHRLDGLPLAIELAAAKIRFFTPNGLLSRLEHRFDILTGGTRDLPERQRTLKGTIDWSYNLLTDTEKKLLGRLSVFVDGWSLEAAEVICNINGDLDHQIVEAMTSLVDDNLVIQQQENTAEPRFGMLATILDYASERFLESGEMDSIHKQHASYFLKFVTDVEKRIRSAERVYWQNVMEQDSGNIRGVMGWASETRKCVEIAQQIIITIGIYWHTCGYIREGQYWCAKMMDLCDVATPVSIRAGLLSYKGLLARALVDPSPGLEASIQSLELSRKQEDKSQLVKALIVRGMFASAIRDLKTATAVFEEAIEVCRSIQDQWSEVIAMSWLGDVALMQDDSKRAHDLHEECVRIGRIQGDPWCLMPALMTSAELDMLSDDLDSAHGKLMEIVDVLQKVGDQWSLSWTIVELGYVLFMKGDLERARDCFIQGLSFANTFGNYGAVIIALVEAAAYIAKISQHDPSRLILVSHLCGATSNYLDIPGIFIWISSKKLYEDAVAQARLLMDTDMWNKYYSEGENIPIDQAVAFATQALHG